MKATKILLIPILIVALYINNVQAQQSLQVKAYSLMIEGTSSLHDWESTVEKLDFKGTFTLAGNSLTAIKGVVATIPVKSIKSPKGKMMDNKTYEAFNYEKNPNIIFTMTGSKIDERKGIIDALGTLTMAGMTKPIDLSLNYKLLPDGDVRITGSKKLLMTDFKMEPPTAMMGAIKVADEVVVKIDLTLTPGTQLTKTK
ncbi:MAG TPA: YceI family protein [Chryseosolibacter sp.]